MPRLMTIALFLLLSLLAACATPAQGPLPATSPASFRFEGAVTKVELEGGFYGLVDPQGNRYDPDRLPADFRIDGLKVRAWLEPLPPAIGFHMWGKKVRLISIEQR
jgi:hypothetical protein